MRELIISENEASRRLDKFLRAYMREAPSSFVYKMLRRKNITLNGKKADGAEILHAGDAVKLFLAEETIEKFRRPGGEKSLPAGGNVHKGPALSPAQILCENRDVLIYNKEAGLLVQKARPDDWSLAEELTAYLEDKGMLTDEDRRAFRPSPVMRIDRNTSGIVLCGLTLKGAQELSSMIRERRIRKFYTAITRGCPSRQGLVRSTFTKDERKNLVRMRELADEEAAGADETVCESIFRVRERIGYYAVVEAELLSGKSHQLRAQLGMLGAPIVGDLKYGTRDGSLPAGLQRRGQYLHAARVVFPENCGQLGDMSGRSFEAPLPDHFQDLLRVLRQQAV